MTIDRARLEAAFIAACQGELQALKPGNVHIYAPGHRMIVADFEASAAAAAPPLCEPGASVGRRIEGAVRATWDAVAMNTNLGIVLLAAPLVTAAELSDPPDLRARLATVLDGLTIDDAEQAFRAIALANPAGLGRVESADVAAPARITLREAMELAAGRDLIARQYVTGFADVLNVGLPRLVWARDQGWPEAWAVTACYMEFLSAFPDSHIVRKHGAKVASEVFDNARRLLQQLLQAKNPACLEEDLQAFDNALKLGNINPGTCADLTVATLLASAIMAMILPAG